MERLDQDHLHPKPDQTCLGRESNPGHSSKELFEQRVNSQLEYLHELEAVPLKCCKFDKAVLSKMRKI